ncbi:MAG: hypothetical protein LBD12_04480, partial [Clostridiales Family XIII bacterium]|nr:hypothetical protein [Clostridiales Family XIII bacterium]
MGKRSRLLLCMLLLSAACALSGLGGCSVDASGLDYLKEGIEVAGIEPEAFTVTVSELADMDTVRRKAEAQRSNGDIVRITAVGPTLETFLSQYGRQVSDFTAVRFSSTDGYSIAVPREILEKREVVLAFMDGGKSFGKTEKPLRAVVVGERAMYWARMVERIDFETGTEDTQTEKVVFLDTVLPAMKGAYNEEDKGDAVSTIDLLTEFGGLADDGKVVMRAFDGLVKNETMQNFLKGYLKYTGEDVPQFCSPDLPEGMNLNGIVSIRTDTVLYVSLSRSAQTLPKRSLESGAEGIGFSDIVKGGGLKRANLYYLTYGDGDVAIYSEHEMAKGVFVGKEGAWSFIGADGGLYKDVSTVEAAEAAEAAGDPIRYLSIEGDVREHVFFQTGTPAKNDQALPGDSDFAGTPLTDFLSSSGISGRPESVYLISSGDGFVVKIPYRGAERAYVVFSREKGWCLIAPEHPVSANATDIDRILVVSKDSDVGLRVVGKDGQSETVSMGRMLTAPMTAEYHLEGRADASADVGKDSAQAATPSLDTAAPLYAEVYTRRHSVR